MEAVQVQWDEAEKKMWEWMEVAVCSMAEKAKVCGGGGKGRASSANSPSICCRMQTRCHCPSVDVSFRSR